MHERHMRGDVREIKRLFDGRVAAAHHGHLLVLEEESIAGCAGRHAASTERLFGRQAQILRRRTRRDDQCVAGVRTAIAFEPERPLRQIHAIDVIVQHFGVEALRMLSHPLHQPRSSQSMRIAGPVIDFGGGHELTAFLEACDEQGLAVRARGIDRSRVAGGTRAQNDESGVPRGAHVSSTSSNC